MPHPLDAEIVEEHRKNNRLAKPAPRPRPAFALSHLGTLVCKELHDLVLTLRFSAGTTLAVLLAVLAAYIGSLDYNARLDSYQTKLKLTRDSVAETRVYSFLRPTIYRPPEPLSVLNRGLEGRLGTDYWVSIDVEHTEAEGQNRGNEYLAIFSEVDLTVVVAVILGLLALLFTFDSVCGEREAGMLKLTMSYPVSRSQFLLGKFLGAWLTLMIPTAVACILSVLVVWMTAQVHFGPPEYVRLSLLFLLCGLYLTVMLLVGLVVSAFSQRSFVALVFCTFTWFLFVTIAPNLASMIPQFTGRRGQVYEAAQKKMEQVEQEQEAAVKQLRDPRNFDEKKEPMFLYHYAINNSWGGFTAFECHFGSAAFYDQTRDFFSQLIQLSLRLAAKRADIWREYIRYRERQAAEARVLSFFSPSAVFRNAAACATGTSQLDYNHFIYLAGQYRNTFIGYLQRKGAFSTWRWFTPDFADGDQPWTVLYLGKTAEEMIATGENPQDVLNRWLHDKEAWARFLQHEQTRDRGNQSRLALGDMPAFTYTRRATGSALAQAAPEIACLLLLNLVLFLVAYVRFVRYDVR
jgi:ABC-type transport system involved in multi-copper enzyme maturation permease subunit